MAMGMTLLVLSSNSGFPIILITSVVGSSPGVWASRYFSTKQVTPFLTSHFATSYPSLFIDKAKNAPPGQMITAVPLDVPASGRNTLSVGLTTLYTTLVCHRFLSFSASFQFHDSDPGAAPSYSCITFCWACKINAGRRRQKKNDSNLLRIVKYLDLR